MIVDDGEEPVEPEGLLLVLDEAGLGGRAGGGGGGAAADRREAGAPAGAGEAEREMRR